VTRQDSHAVIEAFVQRFHQAKNDARLIVGQTRSGGWFDPFVLCRRGFGKTVLRSPALGLKARRRLNCVAA
jgi:hypothetical protein